MKLINIKDEELFQECIELFYDKLNIIIPIIIGLMAITVAITAYYKDQPLINFFINILLVFGIYYCIIAVLLFRLYRNKLKEQKKVDKERKSNSRPRVGVTFLENIGGENIDKWADYCISAVSYNSKKTHIEKVKVHKDHGNTIGNPSVWLRTKVVSSLENGNTFVTISNGTEGKWNKGADVRIVIVNGTKYIRTDMNQKAGDNLGNLPEF